MRRHANRSDYGNRKDGVDNIYPIEPGDEIAGTWPKAQLERMDRRFVERMARAIKQGREHPEAPTKGCKHC